MDVVELDGPLLVLAVGPAASGKSTVLEGLLADGVIDEVVSTDAIRVELCLDLDDTATAYTVARERLRCALRARRVVALDATNVAAVDRAPLHELAAAERADVVALRIGAGLTLADLVARDAGRNRHVPVAALRVKLEQFRAEGCRSALSHEPFVAIVDAGRAHLVRLPARVAVPA